MKRFLKHLVTDVVLWVLLGMCLFQLPYWQYAENIISFYGVLLLIVGSLSIFTTERIGKSFAEKSNYKPRSKLYLGYMAVTTVVEIIVVASMGWYWVAAGFTIYSITMWTSRNEAERIYYESH